MQMTLLSLEATFANDTAEDPYFRPCESTRQSCPNAACYAMRWRPVSDEEVKTAKDACHCGTQRLCLACKDWVLFQQGALEPTTYFKCRRCEGYCQLAGVEPIR